MTPQQRFNLMIQELQQAGATYLAEILIKLAESPQPQVIQFDLGTASESLDLKVPVPCPVGRFSEDKWRTNGSRQEN